ncbi:hypothetical protein GH733_006915 [Mirounga leonina]|nr:hypothetical protein GH733_006915 [Mirounga leonina]
MKLVSCLPNRLIKMVHAEAFSRPLSRNEVVGLIFRLTIFGAVTYFTIKWMVDAIDPTRKQKVEAQKQVTWSDIAGLDDVITDLKDTVILPIKKKHLFENSRLLQPPKGVLLYGPPGCGKTLIAKATAKEAGCRFINLQPSTLTDKWYGESQKLAAAVFSLAIKLQPSIIFIDEIDSFLRNRSSSDHEATAMMKAQFMSLWDGLDTDHSCQVIVMGATNRPQDLDSAIMRRMPTRFHINQPALKQREAILKLILKNENVDRHVDLLEVAQETDGFSGSDLKEMCRDAALLCVREYVNSASEERPPLSSPAEAFTPQDLDLPLVLCFSSQLIAIADPLGLENSGPSGIEEVCFVSAFRARSFAKQLRGARGSPCVLQYRRSPRLQVKRRQQACRVSPVLSNNANCESL